MTLSNLGLLYRTQNQMEEALRAYEEALPIYRKLAVTNRDTYLPFVARVLWGIGHLHLAKQEWKEAQAVLSEALDIFSKFAERDPAQYGPFVKAVKEDLTKIGN